MSESVVVRVKPGSRKGPLIQVGEDGELTVYVPERAVSPRGSSGTASPDANVRQLRPEPGESSCRHARSPGTDAARSR